MPDPHPKGKKAPRVKRLPHAGWNEAGMFTMVAAVGKPRPSASRKCYMLAFEHGELDQTVMIEGKERQVRLTFMLYVKIPASERRATLLEEAKRLEREGDPRLY